jgi:hypothetical protein
VIKVPPFFCLFVWAPLYHIARKSLFLSFLKQKEPVNSLILCHSNMLLEKPIMLCKKKANNEDRLLAKYAFINPNVI